MFPSVLIVDDEPSILQTLGGILSDEGFEVMTASNGYEGLKIIEAESPDLVLLDIWMPGIDGIETLKEIRKSYPYVQVVIITGHGNIEMAVKATKLGAFDLIEKPLSIDKVIVCINNALNFRRLEEENRYLRKKAIEKHSITGSSPAVAELRKQIATVAPTDSYVLITGENGSGKELVARTLHHFSSRAEQPLICVNCASIAQDVLENELFGQEKSGADSKKRGGFELADQGTLFLDEIGDMSLDIQAKILRVLEHQHFQRVGGGRTLKVNVRIISASNKNLEEEIANGNFRQELYYRLRVIPIVVPSLRDRSADIPQLTEAFLCDVAAQNKVAKKTISPEALQILSAYSWPGNVRELKNLISRLAVMTPKDRIEASDIPAPYNPEAVRPELFAEEKLFSSDNLNEAKLQFEREFIRKKLLQHGHNLDKTAGVLGVTSEYIRSLNIA
jgi:two-component system nitrogen regulation response regulator NtrX